MEENMANQANREGLTTELFGILKKMIIAQFIVICLLIVAMIGQHIYHIYQWSQFDTVVVESGENGDANYIGNDGDINYGEGSSTQAQEDQQAPV